MILTRHEISDLVAEKKLNFSPGLDAFQLQPHAVDLRLGTIFYLPKMWQKTPRGREILTVDLCGEFSGNLEKIEIKPGQFFDLAPGESVIGSTLEKIELASPSLMGVLYPRSSINRRGLSVDLTGIIDAFYCGHLMIPILNKTAHQIIRIWPGERICQILFHSLHSDLDKEDALLHGKVAAKYHAADGQNVASKKDDPVEIELIRSGDFEKLKKM